MRILKLAKELGVSHERLLNWSTRAGMPYTNPEDEVEETDEPKIRQAFAPARLKGGGYRQRGAPSPDRILDEIADPSDFDLEDELPDTLEELEVLERKLMQTPPELRREKPAAKRITTRDVLERYGIRGKSVLKRLRKLLPGHASRLLNQQTLSESQHATLTGEIESRAVFHCGDPHCKQALESRHSPETLFPVSDSGLCALCSGSATTRALDRAAEACRKAGVRRILVVGGMPAALAEMKNNTPPGLEFRLVAGDLERPRQRVQADLRWCDLAVIWGGTVLHHSVSGGYTQRKGRDGPFILRVRRSSIEALCAELIRHTESARS